MASITKRAGKWTVTARLPDTFHGPCKSRSISTTFKSKRDAQIWIDSTESAMRLGTWKDPRLEPKAGTSKGYLDRPFKEALEDYRDKITPEKKGAAQEVAMINMMGRESFALRTVRELTVEDFLDFRDARKSAGRKASTIRNNLNTVSAVYEWLIHIKKVQIANPIAGLRKIKRGVPQPPAIGRKRRVKPEEEARIREALTGETWQNRQWQTLFPVLLDSAMRAGEALSILAGWIRIEPGFVIIPETKNGERREVALSDRAYAALVALADGEPDESRVFKFTKNSCEHEWQKIRKAAKCEDLRIHDLRHEALSRMAANGADLKTLMTQSGHKTVAVLMRYLNPTKEEQRARLFGGAVYSSD